MEQVLHALLESIDPYERALGMRMRNLGILRWHIWSGTDQGSLQDLVAPGGPRCLVVDLGSLGTPGEQALAAESVLAQLWRLRAQRDPVLVVIDEAHNVCPREPADDVTRLSTERGRRIAAEGRKFGLYLLASTQRPQRVNEAWVSQCDNLVLMRMNSAGDLDYLARTLSFAPRPLLEQSAEFNQGEAVVAGKITFASGAGQVRPSLGRGGWARRPHLLGRRVASRLWRRRTGSTRSRPSTTLTSWPRTSSWPVPRCAQPVGRSWPAATLRTPSSPGPPSAPR